MESRTNWGGCIRSAKSRANVLEMLGRFLGSIPPEDIERLSPELRGELRRVHRDIHAIAFTMLCEDLKRSGDHGVLTEMAHAFAAASERLAQIEGDEGRR